MDTIQIVGIRPYDGDWPFDLAQQPLTTREWGWIKRLAGYLPDTVESGLSDPELVTVFAVISLHRAGKVETRDVPDTFERLADSPFGGAIRWQVGDTEEAADEPVPPQRSSSGNDDTSGQGSTTSSETSPPTPTASGTPASVTSLSGRETSAA